MEGFSVARFEGLSLTAIGVLFFLHLFIMKKPIPSKNMTFKELAIEGAKILAKQRGYTYEEMLENERRIQSGEKLSKEKKG